MTVPSIVRFISWSVLLARWIPRMDRKLVVHLFLLGMSWTLLTWTSAESCVMKDGSVNIAAKENPPNRKRWAEICRRVCVCVCDLMLSLACSRLHIPDWQRQEVEWRRPSDKTTCRHTSLAARAQTGRPSTNIKNYRKQNFPVYITDIKILNREEISFLEIFGVETFCFRRLIVEVELTFSHTGQKRSSLW